METSKLIWQDNQHQQLLVMIEQINASGIDSRIFERLTDYADNHFMLEEAYMKRSQYPHTQEHIRAHDSFRSRLMQMAADNSSYDDGVREMLALFLREWLMRHIMGVDKKLEQFILDSDLK
jgi:hemerythrin